MTPCEFAAFSCLQTGKLHKFTFVWCNKNWAQCFFILRYLQQNKHATSLCAKSRHIHFLSGLHHLRYKGLNKTVILPAKLPDPANYTWLHLSPVALVSVPAISIASVCKRRRTELDWMVWVISRQKNIEACARSNTKLHSKACDDV